MFKKGNRVKIIWPCSGNKEGEIKTVKDQGGELFAGECSCQSKWELLNNKSMNNKTLFINECMIDDAQPYRTLGEVTSDNDDILSDDDIVIEYKEVRRFKISKPKVGLVEIKTKTKAKKS